MPEYWYERCDGKGIVALQMTIAEMERREDRHGHVTLDNGVRAKRTYQMPRRRGKKNRSVGRGWPMKSVALAVHPEQVAEAQAYCRKVGVPTEFQPTGEPILRNRRHRKEVARAFGVIDRDGGYSDP